MDAHRARAGWRDQAPGLDFSLRGDTLVGPAGLAITGVACRALEQYDYAASAVEYVTRRLWSSTWVVPDPLFAASVERLKEWANGYFGAAMDSPHVQERQFVICKTQV